MKPTSREPHPYPAFLVLAGQPVLVVGGGPVAERRIEALLGSGAVVTVVAPQASAQVAEHADAGALVWRRRDFEPADVVGCLLVFSATGVEAVDRAVARAAREAGALVNVADDPESCDFHVPAIERRGRIQLAVGSGGGAPGMAAVLRDRLAAGIGPEWPALADLLATVRDLARSTIPDSRTRMRVVARAARDADLRAAVARGDAPSPGDVLAAALVAEGDNPDDTSSAGPNGHSPTQPTAMPTGAFVSIVGAGPGAPDLITLRGLERIRSADVVLYDDLVDRRLLDEAPPAAELVYAGKRGWREDDGARPGPETLVQRALEGDGRHVVRLKGGDPSVFGRLDEELAALESAGIAYEIVPGVTSALAAAASAGIPLTARGTSSSVTFAAAIASGGAEQTADILPLVRAGGTVVIYMGLRTITEIAQQLLSHDIDPELPVTIVSAASTPAEKVVRTSLSQATTDVAAADIASPALVVIGRSAG